MSGIQPSGQGSSAPPGSNSNGAGPAMGLQHPAGGGQGGNTGSSAGLSQQNLNGIVIEYLSKKGYTKTEAMLRSESANTDKDGRPLINRAEDLGGAKYTKAFNLLRSWIDSNLEIYKPELERILWPVYVYSFLNLMSEFSIDEGKKFFASYHDMFVPEHQLDLTALSTIVLPEHVASSEIAKIYRGSRYRLTFGPTAFYNLIQFLEAKEKDGGSVIVAILQEYCHIHTREALALEGSLAALLVDKDSQEVPAEEEGIAGYHGKSTSGATGPVQTLEKVKLGKPPMEPELLGDVQAELVEEDEKNPPGPGQNSLVQEFAQRIKREDGLESPYANEVPLPPSMARDVKFEVQRVKENRDRFAIESRTGGIGPGVSVIMYTFHNTYDSLSCIDFSQDNLLVAAGSSDSYIKVWSLDGKPLTSSIAGSNEKPSLTRKLIGHSGPITAVSFSPAIANPSAEPPSTGPKYLLSSSVDKTVRLWDVETWHCLVAYKGHNAPVWDVQWGPFGHYFVTGAYDRTARLWATEHISCLRIFAGHDRDVDVVTFHPNSAYVFTGSCDRTVRMWAVNTGNSVRLFSGHKGNITSLECSPHGKSLASGDDTGAIIIWDLATGKGLKRMRGHGKGGIWSLSWSVESNVLVSAGHDGTVRVWDIELPKSEAGVGIGKVVGEGGSGTKIDAGAQAGGQPNAASGATGSKKKGKEVVVTPDQISAFPTKRSPVKKVRFTRQNLVLAASAYMP